MDILVANAALLRNRNGKGPQLGSYALDLNK